MTRTIPKQPATKATHKHAGALLRVAPAILIALAGCEGATADELEGVEDVPTSPDAVHDGEPKAAVSSLQRPTFHGCASGWACIYPKDVVRDGDRPSLRYYHYGSYQLSNQFGVHYVYNNQFGGAIFYLCRDWFGNDCPFAFFPGQGAAVDLTPINSVRLL